MLIKTDPSVITGYLEDASGFTQGHAERLVIPETESEIAEYLKQASPKKESITIVGGRTGVTAGCIARGGTLLSLERLDTLHKIELTGEGGWVTLGPAVRLETLISAAAQAGLIYGPDPTEKTGTLGGNASTNASGGRSFKYGATRKHVLALTAVLSTGEILRLERGRSRTSPDVLKFPLSSGRTLECQRPMLPSLEVTKNAAGYFSAPNMDPIDLLIGMDGTLAVLTSLKLKLLSAPSGSFTLAVFFPDISSAIDCAAIIRRTALDSSFRSSLAPASLEFMNQQALDLLRPEFPNIPDLCQAVLLIEQEYSSGKQDEALTQWSEFLDQRGVSENMIWYAETEPDVRRLQEFRHALPEAVNRLVRQRNFPKVGTDMAVPEKAFPEMLNIYRRGLESLGLEYLIFGHIGECHLHVNILPCQASEFQAAKDLYLQFAREAVARGGTVSAEHGIGKIKHAFMEIMVGEPGLREMARVKRVFDPAGILNRGNIFPEKYLE
ncbi:FAD-binding oxidoreductase [bacterium]|nr:FAD-binding oxidoreductase [bacterium]